MRYAVVASCEDFYQYVVTIDGLRWLARRIRKQNSPMNSPKCQRLGKSLSNWKNLLCIAYRFREKFFKNHQGKVIYDFVKYSPLHTDYLVCSKQNNQAWAVPGGGPCPPPIGQDFKANGHILASIPHLVNTRPSPIENPGTTHAIKSLNQDHIHSFFYKKNLIRN